MIFQQKHLKTSSRGCQYLAIACNDGNMVYFLVRYQPFWENRAMPEDGHYMEGKLGEPVPSLAFSPYTARCYKLRHWGYEAINE